MDGFIRMLTAGAHKLPWLPDFIYRGIFETMFMNRKERSELLAALVLLFDRCCSKKIPAKKNVSKSGLKLLIRGNAVYEIDNGTIEVIESGGLVSIETVFIVPLGIALLIFLRFWVRGQKQNLSKKSKKSPKVETGTRSADTSMDESLVVFTKTMVT
ncbi:hypothetical protein L2E82_25696 [Cichorium intybus]|uniref:Uncharacterized protein n=1 Tax=Cichorium intybus TaxID=13427 RepID=A0ACB9E4E3_CICIN|nr:hypothetical protein L2E82_25696 [Cichorium intybus]